MRLRLRVRVRMRLRVRGRLRVRLRVRVRVRVRVRARVRVRVRVRVGVQVRVGVRVLSVASDALERQCAVEEFAETELQSVTMRAWQSASSGTRANVAALHAPAKMRCIRSLWQL